MVEVGHPRPVSLGPREASRPSLEGPPGTRTPGARDTRRPLWRRERAEPRACGSISHKGQRLEGQDWGCPAGPWGWGTVGTGSSAQPLRGASGLLQRGTSCVPCSPGVGWGAGGGWRHELLLPSPEFCPRGHTWRPGTATWHRFWSSGDGGRLWDGPFGGAASRLLMTSCPKAAGGHCCHRPGPLAAPEGGRVASTSLGPGASRVHVTECPSFRFRAPGCGCHGGTGPGPRTAVGSRAPW